MKLMYEPGSYSVNISTERSVTSLRHDGARDRPVSVNHDQESGVGSAEGASGSSATTGIMARGFPAQRLRRSSPNMPSSPAQKSARINRLALLWPLIKGTCPATHLTLRSIAPTTSTWPPL